MSDKRLFDIFKFNKPNVKSTLVSVVANTGQESEDVDNELSSCISVASSSNVVTSCASEFGSDYDSTTSRNNTFIDNEICDLGNLQSGPVRPILKSYPMTKFGRQNRSFNSSVYDLYDWVEYSIKNDAIYCFPCRNYISKDIDATLTFTKIGFKNWKKLTGSRGLIGKKQSKLDAHSSSKSHITCVAQWLGHKNSKTAGTVHIQLESQHKQLIEANQIYIKTLIDITLYLSCQGLPFRGHVETVDSINQGNFKEMCHLISKYVPEFAVKFNKETNYTSPLIQNNIIEICATNVRDQIISEIGNDVFGIMCDEARCFKEEQMSLCMQYCKGLNVVERFLGFINCSESQSASALSEHILNYLKDCGLHPDAKLVAQSYDGANVMSGRLKGVQANIKQKYPYAIFTHCMAHRVNLVVLDMCKVVKETRSVFHTLESLYVHFSHPANNTKLIEMQNKLGIKQKKMTKLSDTRWNFRFQNCEAVKNCYDSLVKTLEEEIENATDKDSNEALGILINMKKIAFIVHLSILHKVLTIINILSNQLQSKTATLGNASNIIKSLIKSFEDLRTPECFSSMWREILKFLEKHNLRSAILSQSQKNKRKRFEPCNHQDFVLTTTTSAECMSDDSEENSEIYFRKTAFFPVLDSLIINLKKRFSFESLQMAVSVDNFLSLNFDESIDFIYHFKDVLGISMDCLKAEMTVANNCLTKNSTNDKFTTD